MGIVNEFFDSRKSDGQTAFFLEEGGVQRMCNRFQNTPKHRFRRVPSSHPLLARVASGTDRELAQYVQFLKEENKILRNRIKGEVHTNPEERNRLLQFGKALRRANEELITIVSLSTVYRWMREKHGKKTNNPMGGQRKPCKVWAIVIEIACTIGFGYTRILGVGHR